MKTPPTETELKPWHQWFAVACNNRAWDLAVQTRGPAEDEEMLHSAHASALHWQAIGGEQNQMRATMLLAEVHALLGMGSTALPYAETMRGYFLNRETPDWEVAFTHVIYAHAASVAGVASKHRSAYDEARTALDAIERPEDREIVEATFTFVPAPQSMNSTSDE